MSERFLFHALLGIIALSPLPLASSHSWAWASFSAIAGLLLAAWGSLVFLGRLPRHQGSALMSLPGGLFFAAMLWAVIQMLPVTPEVWHHPLWKDAAATLALPYHGSISLDPTRGVQSLIRLATAGAIFWLSFQLCREPENARKGLQFAAAMSAVYAGYGILEYFSGTETIVWMRKYAYFGDLTSTFVNRNHYATFAGLGWLCFLALLFRGYSNATRGTGNRRARLREALVFFERSGWVLLVGILLQATALILSHSRAGFFATIIGILALGLCLGFSRDGDRKTARNFAVAAIGLAALFYFASGSGLDKRLGETEILKEDRVIVYNKTQTAIMDQPILGTGLGTFEEVFRFYRPYTIAKTFDYAHNTYLESALELGIPATVALMGGLLYLFFLMVRGVLTRRRNGLYPCLGVSVMVLVGVHSLVDFSVQIPALTYFFYFLVGLGSAQSISSRG